MAVSGLILAGFVLGHMLGNLQVFLAPDWINRYAWHLQHLPYGLLWVVRLVLLSAVAVHVAMAALLTIENRRARPVGYLAEDTLQASYASRTMIYSGLLIGAFIVFHLLHFTVKNIYDYSALHYALDATGDGVADFQVHNVYAMMYLGFTIWPVSAFYAIATFFLCQHLGHGVSSMFQSLGLRNHKWRLILDRVALVYGWGVFLGFVSIPVAVLLDFHLGLAIFDKGTFSEAFKAAQSCCPLTGF